MKQNLVLHDQQILLRPNVMQYLTTMLNIQLSKVNDNWPTSNSMTVVMKTLMSLYYALFYSIRNICLVFPINVALNLWFLTLILIDINIHIDELRLHLCEMKWLAGQSETSTYHSGR